MLNVCLLLSLLMQKERDRLQTEIENLSSTSDGQTQKLQDLHAHKLKSLESQIQDLKKKKDSQVQIMKQKQKSDEAAKKLQDEIQYIKAQKVGISNTLCFTCVVSGANLYEFVGSTTTQNKARS